MEKDGIVCHTSYLMPACWKFPFMKKGEYEIGPCRTLPEYRGQGIYPTVLKTIIAENKETTFHIMAAENNISSIRGIEKAGFKKYGKLIVTAFKQFKKYEEKQNE